MQGVNPPRKQGGAPPYRADVPCETQQTPDLRSIAGAPPQQIRINQNAPGAAERREQVEQDLIKWMKRSLESSSLRGKLTVSDEPLKATELGAVRKTLGGGS